MENNNRKRETQKLPDPYDLFLDTVKVLSSKMTHRDYYYLNNIIFDLKDKIDEIKERK